MPPKLPLLNLFSMKKSPHNKVEYTLDATDQILGRFAVEIATLLQGKNLPTYEPNQAGNAIVKVTNIAKMKISGNKAKDKVYYHHTGYMGHLKEKSYEEMFAKDPTEVLRMAVYNMLPKNRLRQVRLNRLKMKA